MNEYISFLVDRLSVMSNNTKEQVLENIDQSLCGNPFYLGHIDLLYLYLLIKDRFDISFVEADFDEGFSSVSDIALLIEKKIKTSV